jgi:predicted nucleic acid-binding protein
MRFKRSRDRKGAVLRGFQTCQGAATATINTDAGMVRPGAVESRDTYGVRFYDGTIVAAAERSGSTTILSEDFSAGQKIFDIVAEHPFS